MTRLSPALNTVKRLFALSGNQCAFPRCKVRLVEDSGVIVGEICHIEAAEPGGPRFNPMQSDTDRRQFENLILLCANHHRITDSFAFTVEKLREMKNAHERRFRSCQYVAPDEVVAEAVHRLRARHLSRAAYIGAFNLLGTAYPESRIQVRHGTSCRCLVEFPGSARERTLEVLVETVDEDEDEYGGHGHQYQSDDAILRDRIVSWMGFGRPAGEMHLFLMFEWYRLTEMRRDRIFWDSHGLIDRAFHTAARIVREIDNHVGLHGVCIILAAFDNEARVYVPPAARLPWYELRQPRGLGYLFDPVVHDLYFEACRRRFWHGGPGDRPYFP